MCVCVSYGEEDQGEDQICKIEGEITEFKGSKDERNDLEGSISCIVPLVRILGSHILHVRHPHIGFCQIVLTD
jgi:hypothetical protein